MGRTLQPLTTGASCRASCGVAGPLARAVRAARHLSRGESGAESGATRESRRVTVPNGLRRPGRQAPAAAAFPSAFLDPIAAPCVAQAQLSRSHRWPRLVPGMCVGGGDRAVGNWFCACASLSSAPQVPCSIYISALPIIPLACSQSWKRGVSPSVTTPPQGWEPRGARG